MSCTLHVLDALAHHIPAPRRLTLPHLQSRFRASVMVADRRDTRLGIRARPSFPSCLLCVSLAAPPFVFHFFFRIACLPYFASPIVCPLRVTSSRTSASTTRLSSPSSDVVARRTTTTSPPLLELALPCKRASELLSQPCAGVPHMPSLALKHTNTLPYGPQRCVFGALRAAGFFCASRPKQRRGEVRQHIQASCSSPSLLPIHFSSHVRLASPVYDVV